MIRETCHSCMWHELLGGDSRIYDMTHWHVTWLFHMWHDSFTWDSPWLIERAILVCDVTHTPVTTQLTHIWHGNIFCASKTDHCECVPHRQNASLIIYIHIYMHVCMCVYTYIHTFFDVYLYIYIHPHFWNISQLTWMGHSRRKHESNLDTYDYGVASISRLLKITGLFCKRAL